MSTPDQNKKISDFFHEWASDARHKNMEKGHDFAVSKMLSLIPWPKKFTFLDIGCGNGWVVRKIAQRDSCSKVYGIDMTSGMIEYANAHQENEKETYICENLLDWDASTTFDVIFSMEALYYFFPLEKSLEKIYSLLPSNGVFCIGIDYYKENPLHKTFPADELLPKNLYSIAAWRDLFTAAGFASVKTSHIKNPDSDEQWAREMGTLVLFGEKI